MCLDLFQIWETLALFIDCSQLNYQPDIWYVKFYKVITDTAKAICAFNF